MQATGHGTGIEDFVPTWVPDPVVNYLAHTELGHSIRAMARVHGCHASTLLRQIRRVETRRDDPLVDAAIEALGYGVRQAGVPSQPKEESEEMTAELRSRKPNTADATPDEATVDREARRILRRLSETGAVLAVAKGMEKAVVVREMPDGRTTRTAIVDRTVAQAMALKDWITPKSNGRISRYEITSAGRAALKRLLAQDRQPLQEDAYAAQHRDIETKDIRDGETARRVRYNAGESPLNILGRRRDKDGTPFLSLELVAAGERLREDFEIAQMGPRVAQNWERFLTGAERGGFGPDSAAGDGPENARARVHAALQDLGPGLGDIVLRCCCFLEGMETTEKRLGWSARSGKIVLRIALQRLRRHYEEQNGGSAPLIG